jgi:hypothetical protein
MSTDNRRNAPRYLTCVPAGVQNAQKERVGLIRDASTTGALVFTGSKFEVNEEVRLRIGLEGAQKEEVEIVARILRVDRHDDGFWTFKMAVAFNPPRDDLTALFESLAEQQKRVFGEPPKA